MLQRIRAARFRGFSSLDVKVGDVTAAIGRNSAGKTSLLHAVRLACDALALALESDEATPREWPNGLVYACDGMVVADPSRLLPLSEWKQIFVDGAVGEGTTIRIELDFTPADSLQRVAVDLAYGRNEQLKMSIAVASRLVSARAASLKPKSKYRAAALREALADVRPIAVFVPAFYGVTRAEEYRARPIVDRALGGGDQSHIVRNLIARLRPDAIERLNGFLLRAVGARLVKRTTLQEVDTTAHLRVTYRDTNGELEISSAGAGLVSLVALFASMDRARDERLRAEQRPTIFLLDEPEAHLHPRLQGDVGEELVRLAREFGVQLLLATHSVEMINRVGQIDGTVLVALDRARDPSAVQLASESEVIDAVAEFCDLTPYTSLSFLASRRILFHEGPSDIRVLDACARVLFRADDGSLARYRRYTPVPLAGVGNASAHGVLNAILNPTMFRGVSAASPVVAALVRDRDYTREPKAPTPREIAKHLRAIEAVWEKHSIESLFVDTDVLPVWLGATVEVPPARLRAVVEAAIAAANVDEKLLDAAIDERTKFHLRVDHDGKRLEAGRAHRLAREEVRKAPDVWEHGKSRASFVLAKVRQSLKAAGQPIRGDIVDIVERAPPERISDIQAAVPREIRLLLAALAAQ